MSETVIIKRLPRLILVLISIALLPALAASEEPVLLRLTGGGGMLPNKEARNIHEKAGRAVVEDFLKKFPNVHFAAETGLQISGGAATGEAAVLMAMAGGSAGDILYVNFRTIDSFINEKFLYPLDEYILRWVRELRHLSPDAPLALEDVKPEELGVQPAVFDVIRRRGADGQFHIYCLPYNSLVLTLNYRKDLFREAGLDPAHAPRTWDELFEYAEKLTDPLKDQYGLAIYPAWQALNFFWQGGSEVLAEDQPGHWRAVFNDDNAVNTLRYLRKLFSHKKTVLDPATGRPVTLEIARQTLDFSSDFAARKCAMIMDYTQELMLTRSDLPPAVLGLAALPAGPGGRRANEINAAMWGLNSQLKDRAARDAAFEFIRHQASDAARQIQTRIYVQGGYAGAINPLWLEKFGHHEYLEEIPAEWREANAQAFHWGKPEPYGKNCQMIYLELQQPIDELLADPRAAEKAGLQPGTPEYEADARWLKGLLDQAVAKTNVKLLGLVPPEQLQRQRKVAWGVVVFIALAFLAAAKIFMRIFRQPAFQGVRLAAGARTWRHQAQAWLFLAAGVLLIGVWSYIPLAQGAGMAFQEYHILGGGHWVGLDNFIEVYNRDDFWIAVRVTLLYVALSLGAGFVAPIVLALMLHEVPRGKVFFRVVYYLPAIISGLITMFLWKAFFNPGSNGMLNQLLSPFGSAAPKLVLLGVALFALLILTALVHNLAGTLRKFVPRAAIAVGCPCADGDKALAVLKPASCGTQNRQQDLGEFQSRRRSSARSHGQPNSMAARGTSEKFPLWFSFLLALPLAALLALWGHEWLASMWTKAPPFKWLADPDTALLCVILPGVWAGAGPGCLIYLAALKAIPEDIYEAADLDGATPLQKVWHIVLPNLKPLLMINFIGAFIGAFHAMQNIFVMSGSGPLKSTHVLGLEIWMSAFMYLKYGYATAVAWILGALLIGFTLWQLRILKDMKFSTAK